jgi:ferredoxin
MNTPRPAIGSAVRIDRDGLGALISSIGQRGYQVIGPTLNDSVISYGPIHGLDDLPCGWTAEQAPGLYRLKRRNDDALFGYATGPRSLKNFLHPSEIKLMTAERDNGAFRILPNGGSAPRQAFLGVRACELAAAGVQDRVLLEDRFADPIYGGRRRNSLVIAVNCSDPSGVCFCTSMGTGPRARNGFDLALTEVINGAHEFLVEIGTELGAELLAETEYATASEELVRKSNQVTAQAERRIERHFEKAGVPELLKENFDHPQWDDVAARCLACGNCTMVCPTCFCVTVEDSSDVTGDHAERWRKWDSCFTLGFSYIHYGSVRLSTKSRYRQWLTHKLSYWHDQFGMSGCVGCGRCIAWCPVGIDLTQEVEAMRAMAVPDETNRGGE